MAASLPGFGGIASRLVHEGLISEAAMQKVLAESQQQKINLIAYMVDNKLAQPDAVAWVISREFGDPLIDLDAINVNYIPKDAVDEKIIREFNILPIFQRGSRLFVAMSDPTQVDALDALRFGTRFTVETVVAEHHKIKSLIEKIFATTNLTDFDDMEAVEFDETRADEDNSATSHLDVNDEAPVVKFVNGMLIKAITMGASDLHFEPYEKSYRVRFRIDGVLEKMANPPTQLAGKIAARLKVMSQMDISERRVPQDGRIKLKISKDKAIDFRVNSLPTLFGEKIVLRILDPSSAMLGIDAVSYTHLRAHET